MFSIFSEAKEKRNLQCWMSVIAVVEDKKKMQSLPRKQRRTIR